ncbi:uncharacterized protein LOC115441772 isoform X3 [Manduca sexta]|uniref:uncharacterized protein LOC115441772 isoform X3 n=1 Tax=Manduca sexta TaxID=7130 RepID=UPI0011845AAF|nr:uncharacterized protein LOC115441772 isoform X3 [Manduca sexta]
MPDGCSLNSMQNKVTGWALLALICSSTILHTLAYPQHVPLISQATSNVRTHSPQYYSNSLPAPQPDVAQERKFAEKPNALKKVALDDLDDIQTNSISDGGFSWTNVLGMLMQMIFNTGGATGPNKSDTLDTESSSSSPWPHFISMGLKILTALLGGGASSEGIDKVDNGSPMQFINIVMNLLDALKTSFSHRSLAARSMGRKDSVSDAAIAGIVMTKPYVRSFATDNDKCHLKNMCEAASECSSDIGPKSIFCPMAAYFASFVLERQSGASFDQFKEAGRRGRSGADCRQIYLQCNEV